MKYYFQNQNLKNKIIKKNLQKICNFNFVKILAYNLDNVD